MTVSCGRLLTARPMKNSSLRAGMTTMQSGTGCSPDWAGSLGSFRYLQRDTNRKPDKTAATPNAVQTSAPRSNPKSNPLSTHYLPSVKCIKEIDLAVRGHGGPRDHSILAHAETDWEIQCWH